MIFATDAMAGRRVLVTGASSGLGHATAALIAAAGGRVIGVGRDLARLERSAQAWPGESPELRVCDLAEADAVKALVAEVVANGGPLDGVFHAAGEDLILPARLTRPDRVAGVFGAATFGALALAGAAARAGAMADGGAMVFMSSVSARRGRPGMSAYAASRAAVEGAVRALAMELAPRAIRINALAAGGVATPMNDRALSNLADSSADAYVAAHPLGLGRPQDVAAAAVFLLSPAARWITGTTLVVDGGYSA